MIIRQMTIDDYDAAYKLWYDSEGMWLNNVDDSKEGIARYLKRNPTTSFVAVDDKSEDKKVIGAILAGDDGRRGHIHHAAVALPYRRTGIGTALLGSVMRELETLGVTKVSLVVFKRNGPGNSFWQKRGFGSRDDLVYRDKLIFEIERVDKWPGEL